MSSSIDKKNVNTIPTSNSNPPVGMKPAVGAKPMVPSSTKPAVSTSAKPMVPSSTPTNPTKPLSLNSMPSPTNPLNSLPKVPSITSLSPSFSAPKIPEKDIKRDDRGFPNPKCTGLASLIDEDCIEGEPLQIVDAAQDASVNVTNAAIHFAVSTGAVGINKVLDVLSFTILGLDNLNMENKDAILEKLEEKMILFQYLANDEKSKLIIKKMFGSLALVIMEGSEVAKVPLLRAFMNISDTTVKGVDSIMKNGSKFIKNAIKIIPGIGDAYIILDNALAVGIAGSRATALMAKNSETLAGTADKIIERMKVKIEPRSKELEENKIALDNIRNNLDNLDVQSVIKNAQANLQNDVARNIQATGNNTANAIYSVTPKTGGKKGKKGNKTKKGGMKSSLKKKNKLKSKRVRFNL